MARQLSEFSRAVFDALECDPVQGGCGAKKGERCYTKRNGNPISYPHEPRRREYLAREERKKKPSERVQQVTNEVECLVVKGGCGAPKGNMCVGRTGYRVTGGYHTVREKLFEGGPDMLDDVPVEKQKPYWPDGDIEARKALPTPRENHTYRPGDPVTPIGPTVVIDGITAAQQVIREANALRNADQQVASTATADSLRFTHGMFGEQFYEYMAKFLRRLSGVE